MANNGIKINVVRINNENYSTRYNISMRSFRRLVWK